jgi:hypothetical protein
MLDEMRRHWRQFRDDEPGRRFRNHQERARQGSAAMRVARLLVGVGLLAGGVVLLFIPGPGLLLIVFGAALVAGESAAVAGLLDRAEPPLRERAARLAAWWRGAGTLTRVLVGGLVALGVVAAGVAGVAWLTR